MNRYCYDLHIHSCLSPCADDDMTPANIAGIAILKGLQLAALTDHNSCKNCGPFLHACRQYGIVGVPGMELTTREEIHLVCLFPSLEAAYVFHCMIIPHLMSVKNRPDIFGNQFYTDYEDVVIGEEKDLLLTACDFSLEQAYFLVLSLGGAAYPAHIDREANGIIGVLGSLPPAPRFSTVEMADMDNLEKYTKAYELQDKYIICSSDAHHLWDIHEAEHALYLRGEPGNSSQVRQALIDLIRDVSL